MKNRERPDNVAEAMDIVAHYLDLIDRLVLKLAEAQGKTASLDQDIQRDLRRMGNWFRENPSAAQEIWTYVKGHDVVAG